MDFMLGGCEVNHRSSTRHQAGDELGFAQIAQLDRHTGSGELAHSRTLGVVGFASGKHRIDLESMQMQGKARSDEAARPGNENSMVLKIHALAAASIEPNCVAGRAPEPGASAW